MGSVASCCSKEDSKKPSKPLVHDVKDNDFKCPSYCPSACCITGARPSRRAPHDGVPVELPIVELARQDSDLPLAAVNPGSSYGLCMGCEHLRHPHVHRVHHYVADAVAAQLVPPPFSPQLSPLPEHSTLRVFG